MDRLASLQSIHPISADDYALFTGRLTTKSFKKGEILVRPGQVQKELYLVDSGVVFSHILLENKMQVMAFCYPPDLCVLPESFIPQQPSHSFLECLTDVEVQCLQHEHLQELFDQSQPLERLFRKLTELVLIGLINRHRELQTLSIKDRYLAFCKRSGHLLQMVPHKYIASYLGIDATNFSKLYNTVAI